MSKDGKVEQFDSEIPVHFRPRRLADWLNPTGARKVHSLIDKVYQRKNLEKAWERVRANRGSGGVDGQSLEAFGGQLNEQLEQLRQELKDDTYQPQPVRQVPIPKAGGKWRRRQAALALQIRPDAASLTDGPAKIAPGEDSPDIAEYRRRRRSPCPSTSAKSARTRADFDRFSENC